MQENELKILAIIPSGFCYGVQISTVEFFSRFPPNVKSHFLLTKWTNGDFEKLLNRHNIPSSYSWLGMFSRKLDWYNLKMSLHALSKMPRLYYDVIKLLRNYKPDILFFSNHHELIMLYPVLLFTRKKVVCHMHDPPPAIGFQKKTFRFYGSTVDKFIAITDNVRKRTIALGCAEEKVITIPMSTTIKPRRTTGRLNELCFKAGWNEGVFIIGITGQMTITKGITDLIEAFSIVHKKNKNVRLIIGGKPIDPYYNEIIQLIHDKDLKELIYFPGWLPDVTAFFHNVDAYVLASRHDEGFGMVIAEAMIAEVPVVITASGGAVELVENGISGFIVEKNNPIQMAERLYDLSVDPVLIKKLAIAGRERIAKNFDIDLQSKKMTQVLFSLKENTIVR